VASSHLFDHNSGDNDIAVTRKLGKQVETKKAAEKQLNIWSLLEKK